MRFSHVATLGFEKYGGLLIPGVGILFCWIADTINPFHITSELLYYVINAALLIVGLFLGLNVYLRAVEWMRKRTIWSTEWKREFGTRVSPATKVQAFIPIIVALWNIFRAVVIAMVILSVVGVICYSIFQNFV